jgi:hypothetical protein
MCLSKWMVQLNYIRLTVIALFVPFQKSGNSALDLVARPQLHQPQYRNSAERYASVRTDYATDGVAA